MCCVCIMIEIEPMYTCVVTVRATVLRTNVFCACLCPLYKCVLCLFVPSVQMCFVPVCALCTNLLSLCGDGASMGWFKRGYWIFYAMRSLVPVGYFRNISWHLFTWLLCGSFQWRHGLLFTDSIVWDDKDRVIGFKRSHWIHLEWWSTGSPKLKLFQLSRHSHVTNCRLMSSSAYFPWNIA